MNKTVDIKGAEGNLVAIKQKPHLKHEQKCPMVILMHGLLRTKEAPILTLLADKLQQEGIASIRFDFDGCGQSEGAFEDMTVLSEIVDAQKVFDYIRELQYVNKIALVGHSQGGVVASMLAGELGKEKVNCLGLLAPAAVLKEQAIQGNTLGVLFDPKEIPEYILVKEHKLGRNYLRTAQTLPIYETAGRYKGNVCIIQGKNDNIEPPLYSEKYMEVYEDYEFHLLEKEDHSFAVDPEKAVDIMVEFLKRNLLVK